MSRSTVIDNDTPGVYVTQVDALGNDDGQTIVVEGDAVTQLTDEIQLQLAKKPANNSTIVVDVVLNDFADKAIEFTSSDPRFQVLASPLQIAGSGTPGDTSDDKFIVARATFTFVDGVVDPSWNAPISIDVQARHDTVREDLQIAVVEFQRGAGTTDANYIFPNLRSGLQLLDVEVFDNETAGAVVLESGGSTQLIRDIPAGSGKTDTYDLRLTKAPTANVDVAILTDGLANVVSIDGVAVTPETYQSIGGLQANQIFNGFIIFGDNGTNLTLKRGTGSDLGNFIDEGFFGASLGEAELFRDVVTFGTTGPNRTLTRGSGDFTADGFLAGQTIRVDASGLGGFSADNGDYVILSVSATKITLHGNRSVDRDRHDHRCRGSQQARADRGSEDPCRRGRRQRRRLPDQVGLG